MVEPTKEKEGTTIRGEKTRGRVDGLPGTTVWSYMNVKHGLTGEQLLHVKQALCEAVVEGKPSTLVRIFDPDIAKAKGVDVQDYASLNDHPELILYEGYYGRGRAPDILIERCDGVGPSLLERRMREGAVTVVEEVKAKRKWLSRIGNFMTMGGFLLVILLVVGIVIVLYFLLR